MTGNAQRRNDQNVELLKADFTSRNEYMRDGARMLSALDAMHRAYDGNQQAGGALMYNWLADRNSANTFIGSQQWTTGNMTFADYTSTLNGGPYGSFDGNTEHLRIADAAWQEPGADEFFVWHWCNHSDLLSSGAICSKYDSNGNNASWWLVMNAPGPAFQFLSNATGNPATNVSVTSTVTLAADTWYFVAGYFLASTLMRIWVGDASSTQLTATDLAIGVPASLFNGSAPLAIGCSFNNAPTTNNEWDGFIGIGGARVNTQPGTAATYPEITGFASRLFQMTRWFYQ